MQRDDLPLLNWTPPVQIIPFPSASRVGHASKIARQLSKARTNREADRVLSRAIDAHSRQMSRAGVGVDEVERERREFLELIEKQCHRLNARWLPQIPYRSESFEPGGAA
ncbi:DUF6074 family protein [Rhizobium sp. BK661]|uniref:DUF6074 family protein n=1 Tax=Rhizobium sp. BK661 TaxID=2586991 RepID=UPI00386647C7|nr:hypothetical protein [Rhizobium sp. BK661]